MDTMTNALPPLPTDAAQLLPQKPPMRLLTRLLAASAASAASVGEALAECVLDAASPVVDGEGDINPVAFIEMAAQTCAAAQGYAAAGGPAREGFLVGVKDFACPGTAKAGEVLHVAIRPVAELDGFILVDAAVSRPQESEALASLRVKVYLPPVEHS